MIIRIRYKLIGGHVHCRVFTAKAKNLTFAKAGDLTFAHGEWQDVVDVLQSAVEFLPEDDAGGALEAIGSERDEADTTRMLYQSFSTLYLQTMHAAFVADRQLAHDRNDQKCAAFCNGRLAIIADVLRARS